jgi:hypothetical protein
MEAPTPASALIHSSTLVVAGVFLIIRFSVVFEFTLLTNYILILLGAITLSFGAVTATFQQDIKKLVAYSTISQIGYLVCGCGFCCYEEVLLYLIIHALNKAFLFVLVGYTVHFFAGNTDMRQMGGLYIYSFDILLNDGKYSTNSSFNEIYCGDYDKISLIKVFDKLKEKGYDTTKQTYEVTTTQGFPVRETILPIAKRKIIFKNIDKL